MLINGEGKMLINGFLNTQEEQEYLQSELAKIGYQEISLEESKEEMFELNDHKKGTDLLLNAHPLFRNLYVGALDETNNRYFYDNSGVLRSFPVLPENPTEEQIINYEAAVRDSRAASKSGAPVVQHVDINGYSIDAKISQIILNERKFLNVIANGSINKSDRIHYEDIEEAEDALEVANYSLDMAIRNKEVKNSFGISKKEMNNGSFRVDLYNASNKSVKEAIANKDEMQFRNAIISKMRAQGLSKEQIDEIKQQ
jgi:hypothetical protein